MVWRRGGPFYEPRRHFGLEDENVWCGAAGGRFTNHDVISVLKTSGIEELVAHRELILPQLAATGIEAKVIRKRAGWKVIWGPVYVKDVRAFVENGFGKTRGMRDVRFPWRERTEMAVMWAFPFSVIVALIAAPWWRDGVSLLVILIWLFSFLVFLSFPLYAKRVNPKKRGMNFSKYTVVFDFSRFVMISWAAVVIGLVGYKILVGGFNWGSVFRVGFISFVFILLLSIDLTGSTPVYKSGLHEDRFLRVVLDDRRCRGASLCEQVCPRACYEMDRDRRTVKIAAPERCVQCGACIVQCPFDALYFESPRGEVLPPATVRRFKLNLISERLVKADPQRGDLNPEGD
jgi:NAD-dependent dihydropyrimidine dehydrogenase PreA subunit